MSVSWAHTLVVMRAAHADHLSGAQLLKRRFDAPVAISQKITVVQQTLKRLFDLPNSFRTDGSQFDRLIEDGDRISAGSIDVEAIATPGHTPACTSFKIRDALFTGDALFMDDYGTGRTDFPKESAADLYNSVHGRLYKLPDDTRVFVGHDYQPVTDENSSLKPLLPVQSAVTHSQGRKPLRKTSSSFGERAMPRSSRLN